jgi:hypothetical protein
MEYRTVFLLRATTDPFAEIRFDVDAFLSAPWCEEFLALTEKKGPRKGKVSAQSKRTHELMGMKHPLLSWSRALSGMSMRQRYANDCFPGMYCIQSETELTAAFVCDFVNRMDREEFRLFQAESDLTTKTTRRRKS